MTKAPYPRRIVFGMTSHISAYAFLTGQLKYVSSREWDVHLVVGSDDPGLEEFARSQAVTLHMLPTSRNPSLRDLLFIVRLTRLLRSIRPTVSIMSTPKMGVFGTIASTFARVPIRVYFILGFKWDGLTGPMRRLIRGLDRLACRVATDVVPISESLRRRLLSERLVRPEKIKVIGDGATIGVDVERFTSVAPEARRKFRDEFDVPISAKVVTFVARLTHDKGLDDLPLIWPGVVDEVPEAWLLVVGDPDQGGSVDGLVNLPRISIHGHTSEVEKVFQLGDLNLSLSHREGLGMVPLEAAACKLPTVAFEVTGIVDTVEDGVTGRLAAPGDLTQVVNAISELLTAPEELERLGEGAYEHVHASYVPHDVWGHWQDLVEAQFESVNMREKPRLNE